MSFYVELHCDVQSTQVDECGRTRCESARNESPGILVRNRKVGLAEAHRYLIATAERRGWEKLPRKGWACPPCLHERSNP